MKKQKLMIFDLDGTLFDTKEVNFLAYFHALKSVGIETDLDYQFFCEYCNAKDYRKFLPIIVPGITTELMEQVHQEKKEKYSGFLNKARKNETLFTLIRSVREEYVTAVATTASRKNAEEILSYFQVQDLFDFIVTKEDVAFVKPEPECFCRVMKLAGIDAENTLIFEDSDDGILAAQNSGTDYVRVYGYN